MKTPTLDQASEQVKKVEQAISLARGKWASVGNSLGEFFGISPQTQVQGGITSIEKTVLEQWAPRRFKISPIDQAGWNRWIADGNDILKALAGIAQDSKVSSLTAVVAATVSQTAVDVKAGTVAVVKALPGVTKWLAIAALAIVAGYLVYRFKR